MSTTTKPANSAPTSTQGVGAPSASDSEKIAAARQQFMSAALGMGWQLAIVVLAPILGGFWLDQYLGSAPLWTVLGFVLAMIGMGLVVWRQLKLYSPKITPADIQNAKRLRDQEDDAR